MQPSFKPQGDPAAPSAGASASPSTRPGQGVTSPVFICAIRSWILQSDFKNRSGSPAPRRAALAKVQPPPAALLARVEPPPAALLAKVQPPLAAPLARVQPAAAAQLRSQRWAAAACCAVPMADHAQAAPRQMRNGAKALEDHLQQQRCLRCMEGRLFDDTGVSRM